MGKVYYLDPRSPFKKIPILGWIYIVNGHGTQPLATVLLNKNNKNNIVSLFLTSVHSGRLQCFITANEAI